MKNDFPYTDIIDLPHFHAEGRPYMPNSERAAQFMPFKSLSEYSNYVDNKTDEVNGADDANYTIVLD